MLGKIISPEQSTKMSDFATGVANEKQCLHSSRRLPRCLAKLSLQSNQTQCYKTQSKLPSMIQAQPLSNECEMRRVWACLVSMLNTTIHYNQLSTLWLNKSMMTKSGCVEEDFVKANDFLNLRLKMWMNYCIVAADNLLEGCNGSSQQETTLAF